MLRAPRRLQSVISLSETYADAVSQAARVSSGVPNDAC